MNVTKETITPKKAMEWLKRNVNNRPLRNGYVTRLCDAMSAGEWQLNGETVKFNGNGDLIDGQHRLNACVSSGKPFESYVVRGLEHSAFDTIDTGAPRQVRDTLARCGEKYYSHLSSAIRCAYWLEQGVAPFGGARTIRNTQAVQYLTDNPQLRESTEFAATSGIQELLSISTCAGLHYLGAKAHGFSVASDFWTSVSTGEALKKNMPAFELRSLLIKSKTSSMSYSRLTTLAHCIKAWNAFHAGTAIKCLKWDSEREEFPTIQ